MSNPLLRGVTLDFSTREIHLELKSFSLFFINYVGWKATRKQSIPQELSSSSAEPVGIIYSGSRGTIAQVKCQLIGEGNRYLVRNVKGPVKKGDMITLLECEREARRLR